MTTTTRRRPQPAGPAEARRVGREALGVHRTAFRNWWESSEPDSDTRSATARDHLAALELPLGLLVVRGGSSAILRPGVLDGAAAVRAAEQLQPGATVARAFSLLTWILFLEQTGRWTGTASSLADVKRALLQAEELEAARAFGAEASTEADGFDDVDTEFGQDPGDEFRQTFEDLFRLHLTRSGVPREPTSAGLSTDQTVAVIRHTMSGLAAEDGVTATGWSASAMRTTFPLLHAGAPGVGEGSTGPGLGSGDIDDATDADVLVDAEEFLRLAWTQYTEFLVAFDLWSATEADLRAVRRFLRRGEAPRPEPGDQEC